MKLLFFLLLLPCCIKAQTISISDSIHQIIRPGTKAVTIFDKHYRVIDSVSTNIFFNYKPVPEKGVYVDTVEERSKYGTWYKIAVFYDRALILFVTFYQIKGTSNTLWIDDKIKAKK